MAHDVFISYSSQDKPVADAMCHTLENNGVRCWMAPRDILPGTSFEHAIVDAINSAKAFVIIVSSHSNSSSHVENEVKLAWKRGLTIIPFKIEDIRLNEAFDFYFSSKHWLDAVTPPVEEHLERLIEVVKKVIDVSAQRNLDNRPGEMQRVPTSPLPAGYKSVLAKRIGMSFVITIVAASIYWVLPYVPLVLMKEDNPLYVIFAMLWLVCIPVLFWLSTRMVRELRYNRSVEIFASIIIAIFSLIIAGQIATFIRGLLYLP